MVEMKESKSRIKPTFSSVAAGKREEKKETKERKSYAQTLKQNNGWVGFLYRICRSDCEIKFLKFHIVS